MAMEYFDERGANNSEHLLKDFKQAPFMSTSDEPTLENLQLLMKNNSWQNVINLTSKIITESATLYDEGYCLVLSMRFESLFRLKMYDDLNVEVSSALETLNDSFSERKDNPFLIGFIYSVKMLQCEIKMMTGHSIEAMEQIAFVRTWLRGNAGVFRQELSYWEWQSTCHLINCNIRSRNWKNSIRVMRQMLVDLRALEEASNHFAYLSKVVVLLRLSKLLLQVGGVAAAKLHYAEACNIIDMLSGGSNAYVQEFNYIRTLGNLTKGLLLFGEEQFQEARAVFEEIIHSYCPQSSGGISSYGPFPFFYVFHESKDESLFCSAVNNYSICSLHLKQNLSAIEKIERLISEDPVKLMTDSVVFNLCTMYDLSYSPDISTGKKKMLQKIAAKYNINDPILHWRSFRLS